MVEVGRVEVISKRSEYICQVLVNSSLDDETSGRPL